MGYLAHSVPGAPLFLLRVRRVIRFCLRLEVVGGPKPLQLEPLPHPGSLLDSTSKLSPERKVFYANKLRTSDGLPYAAGGLKSVDASL